MRHVAPPLCVLLLAGAIAGQDRAALVETAPVTARTIAARRAFVGTVEAFRTSTIGSEVAGRVMTFLATEGRWVEKKDPLATLRTTLIEARLKSARAELTLREQEVLELRNGSRKEEIAEAEARVGQAKAVVDIRTWKLENARKLVQSKTISADALRDAELAARVAEQLLLQAEAGLALVVAGPRAERIAQAEARVTIQRAEVERLEHLEKQYTIRAPFDGYVLAEHTQEGQWLDEGGPVAHIAALDQVYVVVPVLEDYVGLLRPKMKKKVTFDALPGRTLDAEIVAIVPRADRRTRSFPVKLLVTNEKNDGEPLLRVGMFARLHLAVGAKRRMLLVPKDAIVLGGPQPAVFTVDPKTMVAVPVPVELGTAVDDLVEVKSGLVEGQQVVTRGNERLRPNQQVRMKAR